MQRDPNHPVSSTIDKDPFVMQIEGIFDFPDGRKVYTGKIDSGIARIGDKIVFLGKKPYPIGIITGVEMFQRIFDQGEEGDEVGLLIRFERGDFSNIQVSDIICHTNSI
ncbi:MAG: hypothetical protein J1F67_09585 [Muribaculaceae bacterium]|nr:hypothetical protein [Muribaculaceae bacterium]